MAAPKPVSRTTLNLRPRARHIAEQRAKYKAISIGEAVSDLIEDAERLQPKTRLETRDGLPVLVSPPGTPTLTMEMVRKMLEEDD